MSSVDVFAVPEKPERDLTQVEVERFVSERVLHVAGALSDIWVDRIAAAVDAQIVEGGLQTMAANAWFTDAAMHEVIMNCPTAHLAQQVLNGLTPADDPAPRGAAKPIRFFYDQTFVKHPSPSAKSQDRQIDAAGDLGNTPWHHDITFWPVRGEQIVSVWIALDKTNLDNGGLEFVPGSSFFEERYQATGVGNHGRVPFASGSLQPLPAVNSATTGERDAELTAISFDLEAGDLLIFDANILHGAPPNLSQQFRRGIALRYFGSDVVLDNDKYGEDTVMAPLDCFDDALSNGDPATGFAYPQVLPEKIPEEIEVRLRGPIEPSPTKMGRWFERNQAASK